MLWKISYTDIEMYHKVGVRSRSPITRSTEGRVRPHGGQCSQPGRSSYHRPLRPASYHLPRPVPSRPAPPRPAPPRPAPPRPAPPRPAPPRPASHHPAPPRPPVSHGIVSLRMLCQKDALGHTVGSACSQRTEPV